MPTLLAMIARRLRRRRAQVDQVWRAATRDQGDAERIRREAGRSQAEARAEAFERILGQARSYR